MLHQSSGFHLLISICVTLIGVFLTKLILDPSTGFDDANITMNFAQNIANGAGYVYYIGGERVEGSSSALWTLINTVAFLFFDHIESPLSALGLIICIATIYIAIQITHLLLVAGGKGDGPAWLTGAAFLFFPSYFAYMVWSLMDMGLFILLSLTMFYCLMRLIKAGPSRFYGVTFIVCAALLSAARPEGVAVAVGMSALLWIGLRIIDQQKISGVAIAGLVAALGMIAVLTLIRLWYFGQPVPNTFYAKVSTSYASQLIAGMKYSIRYLYEPMNLGLTALFFIAITVMTRIKFIIVFWLITLCCYAGVFGIYSALGGDHFGSFRFYQVLTPLLLPWAVAAAIVLGTTSSKHADGWQKSMRILASAILLVAAWGQFTQTKGGIAIDFRIAEAGRLSGEVLNDFEPAPSLGILAAGGIAMTYEGAIFDLLGLNWVEMAHSNRSAMRVKNNSGFSQDVFFNNPPDLILPEIRDCGLPPMDYQWVMDEVIASDTFQQLYRYDCYRGVAFFIKRDIPLPAAS